MTRWLAGVFDLRDHADPSRLAGALSPYAATLFTHGPLRLAYSGPVSETVSDTVGHGTSETAGETASDATAPVCLLDGFLDNAAELSAELGLAQQTSWEAQQTSWEAQQTSWEALLAAGWRRWGRGLPERMRGEFALLVWDRQSGEGLLARDQLGVRSLFVHERGGRLCFASEIRHLLALLPRRPAPDATSLAHWLSMSRRPGSATLYEGVHRLSPGALLLLERTGVREAVYWSPRYDEPLEEPMAELAAHTRAALERAVQRRVAAEGSTGVMMSGGLDSASVAAVAAARAPGRVCAYAAVFPEHPAVDESALIETLRSALRLGGATAEVREGGMLASALESTRAWALPLLSWGDFWALPLLRAAAQAGVRVTLGGDGGDELFGARAFLLADRLRAGHPLQALSLARELPGAGNRPARRAVAAMFAQFALAGALPYRLHSAAHRARARRSPAGWLHPALAHGLLESQDPLAWKRMDGPRWWAEIAHGLTRGMEEVGVFEHQRRRAAQAGLEARHPLFDLDLVELCLRQPPLASLDRHLSRPVLRAAMAGLLPDAVRLRAQKALFDPLLVDSLAGPDRALAHGLLSDPNAELRAYADQGAVVRELFGEGSPLREQPFRWMWQLWRLATAEIWLRAQAGAAGEGLSEALAASPARVTLRPAPSAVREPASEPA